MHTNFLPFFTRYRKIFHCLTLKKLSDNFWHTHSNVKNSHIYHLQKRHFLISLTNHLQSRLKFSNGLGVQSPEVMNRSSAYIKIIPTTHLKNLVKIKFSLKIIDIQKKYFIKNCPVLNKTHSIYYKKNCAMNRFCVIVAYSCPDLAVLKIE